MRKLALFTLAGFLSFGLSAANLTLRDGTVIHGRFISGSSQTIVFQDERGVDRRFNVNQIQTLDFSPERSAGTSDRNGQYRENGVYNDNGSVQYPPGTVRSSQADQYGQYNNGQYNSADRVDNQPSSNRYALLQPGTEVSVRVDQEIDSRNAAEGQTYPASISRDVLDDRGRVAIPRGSEATLVIRRVQEGGTLNNGNFVLDLDSVQVNGRRYMVSTQDLRESDANGIGKNKRTAEMVGGGAVLGTLLGAIAGGGKGAAIGALAGGAAGGGVQVLTKGHEIRVPAETQLNFRLDQSLELREAR